MTGFIAILLAITMGAVLLVLFVGIGAMARGGEFNRRHGNRLMRMRVILQLVAVLLFLLLVAASQS